MRKIYTALLPTILLLYPAGAGELPRIRSGIWEIRTKAVTLESGMETPTMIRERHLDAEALFPHPERYGRHCRQHALKAEGELLEWEIRCSEGDLRSIRARYRVTPKRYEGTVVRRGRSLHERFITVTNRILGRFLRTETENTPSGPRHTVPKEPHGQTTLP